MSEYGYIPEAPEQSFGNNKGIFTPKDIYDLTRADKYTNYGQLELIETQTVSSAVSSVDFTNIKDFVKIHGNPPTSHTVLYNHKYKFKDLARDASVLFDSWFSFLYEDGDYIK